MNDGMTSRTIPQFWWPLPLALALWLVMLALIGVFLSSSRAPAPPVAAPIDARIVELPPVKAPASTPTPTKAQPQPATAPKMTPEPKAIQPRPATPASPKVSVPQAPPTTADKTSPSPPATPPALPKVAPQPASNASGTQQMGAHAIYQPKPELPEDLRDETMHTVIRARFHIAVDGSVTVELIQAAPDPRVNQVILNTLKTWQFFPATEAGKPVPSTQDVDVSIDVGD